MRLLIVLFICSILAENATVAHSEPAPSVAEAVRELDTLVPMVMRDPSEAFEAAKRFESRLPVYVSFRDQRTVRALIAFIKGESLIRMNRLDAAVRSLDGALVLFPDSSNEVILARIKSARASAARELSDYQTAFALYKSSYDIFLLNKSSRDVSSTLLKIGNIYSDAGLYESALKYYDNSLSVFDDLNLRLSYYNNSALVYQKMTNYREALRLLNLALAEANKIDSDALKVRLAANIANVLFLDAQASKADEVAVNGLALARKIGDDDWIPFLWGVRAKVADSAGRNELAVQFIERAFSGHDISLTPEAFEDFHWLAFNVYKKFGDYSLALDHLLSFKRLEDKAQEISASANTALLGAQFDFARQDLEISKLKTDTLEKEVQLARTRAQQRTIIFSAAILLVLLGLAGGSIHYRSVVRNRNEIRKKNDELSQSNLFLEKALKAKSEFLATTSHEIRTPLNGILGTTQVLIHSTRMPEEVRERVELIQIAGEAMKGIVDDLLDVAKMESGTIEVADECFNLQTALSEVSRFWADSAANKGLMLAAELDASPSFIMGDEKRLRQIVYNLLSNAVKFTDEGRVTLSAEVDSEGDGGLVVKVSDTGCGIPEDELDRIFAPFHQVDGGKTRRHGGTGLGLSICQNLAVALGGTVSVLSRPGEGSTFTLRLPLRLAEGVGRTVAGISGARSPDLGPSRLLIVSGDSGVSASLQIPLAMRDVEFDLVESLSEAVNVLSDRSAAGVLVVASVLGADPGEAMERLIELRDIAGDARLVVWLDDGSFLATPMVRLCGADDVLEGDFDPEGALACVLNEALLATEYQGIDVRPNGTMGV